MKSFKKLIKEIDQFILDCTARGTECMSYVPVVFTALTGNPLAGIQFFLPPTTELEGRLLYISTQMKVWFGEIDPILSAAVCAGYGIPEERPEDARAGVYGGFRVVGAVGFQSLLRMTTNDSILRVAKLSNMAIGIERLGARAFSDLECEYDMTQGVTELLEGSDDPLLEYETEQSSASY